MTKDLLPDINWSDDEEKFLPSPFIPETVYITDFINLLLIYTNEVTKVPKRIIIEKYKTKRKFTRIEEYARKIFSVIFFSYTSFPKTLIPDIFVCKPHQVTCVMNWHEEHINRYSAHYKPVYNLVRQKMDIAVADRLVVRTIPKLKVAEDHIESINEIVVEVTNSEALVIVRQLTSLSFHTLLQILFDSVEHVSGITELQLRAKNRLRIGVQWRQMVYFLLKEKKGVSDSQIGREFGGRDHATILNGRRKHLNAIETKDKDHVRKFSKLIFRIKKNMVHYLKLEQVISINELLVLFEENGIVDPIHPVILNYNKNSVQPLTFNRYEIEKLLQKYCGVKNKAEVLTKTG